MKITTKQELFVKEYLVDFNATAAALRAGYSEKTAGVIGYENLKKPQIAKLIEEAAKERVEKAEIDADFILMGIKEIAADPDEQSKDRLKAFELLGKYLKLFTDKTELSGTGGGPVTFQFVEPDEE